VRSSSRFCDGIQHPYLVALFASIATLALDVRGLPREDEFDHTAWILEEGGLPWGSEMEGHAVAVYPSILEC